jgi:hypothetical protein
MSAARAKNALGSVMPGGSARLVTAPLQGTTPRPAARRAVPTDGFPDADPS